MPFNRDDGESVGSKVARLAAAGAFFGGFGYAGFKGYQESSAPINRAIERAVEAVSGGRAYPRTFAAAPRVFSESELARAFQAGVDTMSASGWREFLRRSYEGAAYRAGLLSDTARSEVVTKILNESSSWENARAAMLAHEADLGGLENVYREMGLIASGRVHSGESVSEAIRLLASGGAGADGRVGKLPFLQSHFDLGGRFWQQRFPMEFAGPFPASAERGAMSFGGFATAKRLRDATGLEIRGGVRESNRPRFFHPGAAMRQAYNIPGVGEFVIPYQEYQVGGRGSSKFIQIPHARKIKVGGENVWVVAANHRGKSFAAVPQFSVPTAGGGRRVVSWNEAMSLALHGDENALKGMGWALELKRVADDKKGMSDFIARINTAIKGTYHRVAGSQAEMTQAIFHSQSVIPIEDLINRGLHGPERFKFEDVEAHWNQLAGSNIPGVTVGPLASAGPMAKQRRLALHDWAAELDIFGSNYPMERQFLSRFRTFQLSDEALGVVEANPILGILSRGSPITATGTYNRVIQNKMPSLVGIYSLRKGRSIRPEEAFVSRHVGPMLETKPDSNIEIAKGSAMVGPGQELQPGDVLGKDYRTGREIQAKFTSGLGRQRVASVHETGGILQLQIETTLPFQDAIKIFGPRVQLRATDNLYESAVAEYGFTGAGRKYLPMAEYVGSADALKKIPGEVNRQVAEALFLTSAKRLQDLQITSRLRRGVRRAHVRGGRFGVGAAAGLTEKTAVEMWRYTHNARSRARFLRASIAEGAKLVERFGLSGAMADLAPGLALIKKAASWSAAEDLGAVGGLHYQVMLAELQELHGEKRGRGMLHRMLGRKGLGLNRAQVKALRNAEMVLGMPTMNIGGYASFDHAWGRAGMDVRGLWEIKAQQWGTGGAASEAMIADILQSTIHGDVSELEKAAASFAGADADIAKDVRRIESADEAIEAIGRESFVWTGGGKQFYVPASSTSKMQMGTFVQEIGREGEQTLRRAYSNYIRLQGELTQARAQLEELGATTSIEYQGLLDRVGKVEQDLLQEVNKQWLAANSPRGKMIGSAMPVARSWLGKSHQYASEAEALADTQRLFVRGVTAGTYEKMHKDLMRFASPEQQRFLEAQYQKFMKGENVVAILGRHPTHRPQSVIPGYLQRVESEVEGDFIQTLTLKAGDKTYDLSTAAGMKLDTDFDHTMLKLIGDEKTAAELDKLMKSPQYRRQFIDSVKRQAFISEAINKARAAGNMDQARHIIGLNRLVGGKMRVGQLSNVVGELRAAAAFTMNGKDFRVMSHLLAEMEEGGLTPKKGFSSDRIEDMLQDFVRGKGKNKVVASMHNAWDKLIQKEIIGEGDIRYSKEEVVRQLQESVRVATESGELQAYRRIVRGGVNASKGRVQKYIDDQLLVEAIKDAQSGKGDILSTMTRAMRMGPGSGLNASRRALNAAQTVGGAALNAFKRHWKYPAMGAAIALGLTALAGSSDIKMRQDPTISTTGLAGGAPANIQLPGVFNPRIITAGGSAPGGYQMSYSGSMPRGGVSGLGMLGSELGGRVSIRDNRGAITPEYIRKAEDERYY